MIHVKDFAGLKVVLRCEVDACYQPEQASTSGEPRADDVTLDTLTEALNSLGLEGSINSDSNLKILRGGSPVPQTSLIKLKTRSHKVAGGFPGSGEYLQQYIGQIPTMLVGIHDNGTFNNTKERKLDSEEVRTHAEKVAPGLAKLRAALEEIQMIMMELGVGARLSLLCQDGELCLMQRKDELSLLPEEVLRRFND
jgi:hypothetical protein